MWQFEIDLTVNSELSGVADSPGGDVLGDAAVVGRVGPARLHHDEVAGAGDEEVAPVAAAALPLPHSYGRAVLQPRDHRGRLPLGRVAPHLHLAAQRHLPRVRRRLELAPEV